MVECRALNMAEGEMMKHGLRRADLVLSIALVSGAGLAEPAAAGRLVTQDDITVGEPTVAEVTLYDQTDSPAGAGFASQVFEAGNAILDCRAADDFTVPGADIQWDVGGLQVLGAYISGAGLTPAINVEFFADAAGLPGGASCSYPGLVAGTDYVDDGSGSLDITLPTICSLPAGDYWVSVQADMDSTVGGQWLWAERSAQSGADFAWENPPDGFGTGCTTWSSAGVCGAVAPGLLFSLSGVQVPVELLSVDVD
jgi:hypothetical protein